MPTGDDKTFERTFADLAYTRLRDKAPMLLDYLRGFQLVDKSDDDTRAVGVFGFKLGEELLYAPMFFLNGELKGHELLYIKGRNTFIPLQENWVNYILNRRPFVLGEPEERKQMELGIRNPDLGTYKKPMSDEKVASWGAALESTLEGFDASVNPMSGLTLTDFIKRSGCKTAEALMQALTTDYDFANAVLKFYSPEQISEAVAAIPPKIEKYAGEQVYVVDSMDDPSVAYLSESEKQEMIKSGYLVFDHRKESQKTQVRLTKHADCLSSPDSDGFYEVVLADGKKKVFLISSGGGSEQLNWIRSSGANWGCGPKDDTLMIDLEGKHAYATSRQSILTSRRLERDEEAKQLKGLKDADSADVKDCVVFINDQCRTTAPFVIDQKYSTVDGGVEYSVCGFGHYDYVKSVRGGAPADRVHRYKHPRVNNYADDITTPFYDRVKRVHATGKTGNRPTIMGETLFVPKGVKLLSLSKDPPDLHLPDSAETVLSFFKQSSAKALATLSARKIGSQWVLKLGAHTSHPITKVAAVKFMIHHLGLGHDHAETILQDAGSVHTAGPQYLLKFAFEDLSQQQSVQSPYFNDPVPGYLQYSGVPAYEQFTQQDRLGQQGMMNNKDTYYTNDPSLDDQSRNEAIDAAGKGQKEVLDTAVISGLSKVTDTDVRIDEYVSDLLTALDRLGRLLFMFYWHNDKFKGRYGGQDMLELEDNLRNVFTSVGDLSLFLKQKTISAGGDDSNTSDLGSVLA